MSLWLDIYPGVHVGTDLTLNFTIHVSGTTIPQDITGWNIQFTVHTFGSTTALVTKTVGSGITLTNPTAGQGTIAIAAADTAGITPNINYEYHIERTDSGSDEVLTIGTFPLLAK